MLLSKNSPDFHFAFWQIIYVIQFSSNIEMRILQFHSGVVTNIGWSSSMSCF